MDVGFMAFHQCIHKSPSFKGASKFQVFTSLCLLLMALLKLPSNFKVQFFSSNHDTNIKEEISINASLVASSSCSPSHLLEFVHLKFQLAFSYDLT
jgi:hypothetical protein